MSIETKKRHPLVPVLNSSSIALIIWNIIPFAGVIFFHWQPVTIFVSYALETVVIGVFNVIKLIIVYRAGLPPASDESGVRGPGIIPFFIFHYYFFVFVQLSLFFGTANIARDSFNPLSVFKSVFTFAGSGNAGIILLATYVANCSYQLIVDFIRPRIYERKTMMQQMFEPYGRIFIQQFVVILGSFVYMLIGGIPFLVIFTTVKIWFDLLFNGRDLISWAKENAEKLKEYQSQ